MKDKTGILITGSIALFLFVAATGIKAQAATVHGEEADSESDSAIEHTWEATKEGSAKAWDKTREVSGDTWEATKEGSAKAWDKTREVSGNAWEATKEGSEKAWEATKEGSAKAWDKTKEVSGNAWEATREGSEKAWDKVSGDEESAVPAEAGGSQALETE